MRKFIIGLIVLAGLGTMVWMFADNGNKQASDIELKQLTFKTETQGATGTEGKMQVLVTITNPSAKHFSGNIKINSLDASKQPIDFDNITIDDLLPYQNEKKLTWLKTANAPDFTVQATEGYFK